MPHVRRWFLVAAFGLLVTVAFGQGTPGTLWAPPAAAIGSVVPFRIRSGQAGVPYFFDVSTTGSSPGVALGPLGPVVPINVPLVFHGILGGSAAYASVCQNFDGVTDSAGDATARLHIPLVPSLIAASIDGCFVTLAPASPFGIGLIGNSTHVTLVSADAALPAGSSAPFVPPPPVGSATRYVSPQGSDANDGLTPQTAWRQISWAATHVGAGAIVEIANGTYAGPVMIDTVIGTQANPVIFRASGGNAVVVGAGTTNNSNRNSLFIGNSSWVTIHGLRAFASNRAGVRVSLSSHVTIQGCVLGNHPLWGIFTDYADDLALLGNECFGSVSEHGIYHSNSGDRAVIAGNWCHDNNASGIQINADPAFLTPIGGYVPDGISRHCLVERNLCTNNGNAGGAAINLASVRESVIRNNVITNGLYLNSSGIAMWDDAAGAVWGCKNNLIEHNTIVYASGKGRYCVTMLNGSTGNVLRNNVLVGGRRGAFAWVPDSLPGLVSDANVVWSVDNWPVVVRDDAVFTAYSLTQWQALGYDAHSFHAQPSFTSASTGDWSLAPGSAGRDAGIEYGVATDFGNAPRPVGPVDIGAFER